MAVCSGYIADGIIRGLFGFEPSLNVSAHASTPTFLRDPNVYRGFEGKLRHVRHRGQFYTIASDKSGVSAVLEDK